MNWEHSVGRENVEKAGGISKFVTVMTSTEVLVVSVNTAGIPLTIVSCTISLLSCVLVKVPGGDSVPAEYVSHIMVLSGVVAEGIVVKLHTPFTMEYKVLSSFSLYS